MQCRYCEQNSATPVWRPPAVKFHRIPSSSAIGEKAGLKPAKSKAGGPEFAA